MPSNFTLPFFSVGPATAQIISGEGESAVCNAIAAISTLARMIDDSGSGTFFKRLEDGTGLAHILNLIARDLMNTGYAGIIPLRADNVQAYLEQEKGAENAG